MSGTEVCEILPDGGEVCSVGDDAATTGSSCNARAASFRPEIEVAGVTTRVLAEHVGAIDARRLGELAGHLSPEELWSVDEALITVLDLR